MTKKVKIIVLDANILLCAVLGILSFSSMSKVIRAIAKLFDVHTVIVTWYVKYRLDSVR